MENVENVDRGFFPLGEELKLLPGILTPHGHESLVRLSSWMSFEKAAELFEDFMGIRVSKSVSQRYTEAAGAVYESMQTEEVERLEREMPAAPAGADKLQLSVDGAMVPIVHGQWAEVRTVVIGEVQPMVQERGEWVVHTRNPSYFSRKVSVREFERLALAEIQRRGVENAKQVWGSYGWGRMGTRVYRLSLPQCDADPRNSSCRRAYQSNRGSFCGEKEPPK